MSERVIVIGAGMAGLWTALALAPTGREVTLLERDPPAPEGGPDDAFDHWARRGVGHLRHSHAFLARLRLIIRDDHPELLAELQAAGCRDLGFEGSLTPFQAKSYRPQPVDRDLVILTSRRTTIELIIRRYVERQPHVTIRSETFVRGLTVKTGPLPTVTGVEIEDADGRRTLDADIVIDASGRTSSCFEQLAEAGVTIPETAETCGILYFTRHYRLNPGKSEPPRGTTQPTGDLEYLKYGVFPADNGCFSITICVPEIEQELRQRIVDPEVFDAICNNIPGLVPWIDPDTATGVSRVFGMGDLSMRWRDLAADGTPTVAGFFAVGDSLIRTNPLYGRGCSFAAVGAHLVRDALTQSTDPGQRLALYREYVERELKPYYAMMQKSDRDAIRRARNTLTPGYRPSLRSRLMARFLEDGVAIALRYDTDLLRAALRGFHMLEDPNAWLKRPSNLAKVLGYWARGRKRNAEGYRPKPGPDRADMLQRIGISPDADIERLKAA